MKELPSTRLSLLDRLACQSEDAWKEFYQIYGGATYEFCRNRGLQDADANDVCQEVFAAVEMHLKAGRHDPDKGRFRGWMFRVARNIAIDHTKAQAKHAAGYGDFAIENVLSSAPEATEQEATEFRLEYRRQLFLWAAKRVKSRVDESTWRSFWMTAVDGKTPNAVAKELKMKVGAVYTAKCRVIARMRDLISEFSETELEYNDQIQLSRNSDGE